LDDYVFLTNWVTALFITLPTLDFPPARTDPKSSGFPSISLIPSAESVFLVCVQTLINYINSSERIFMKVIFLYSSRRLLSIGATFKVINRHSKTPHQNKDQTSSGEFTNFLSKIINISVIASKNIFLFSKLIAPTTS